MADVIKTIGATGADYTTLAAFWTARNTNAGAGDIYIAELIDNADYPWGEVSGTFAGSVKVRPATSRKIDFTNPTAPHAKIASTTGSALYWRSLAPITIEDLEIVTTFSAVCLRFGAFEDTNATVQRCLVRGGSTGISHGRATATTLIENCVVTGANTWGISNGFAGITVRNTVVVGNNTSNTASRGGMRKDIAGAVIENVVCYGNLRGDFFGASTTSTVSYLASGDASATGANALTGVTTAAFTNYAGQVYTAANGGVLDGTAAGGADRGLNLSTADIIAITSVYEWEAVSRNKATNTGDFVISGTFSGSTTPASIERRVNAGPWVVLDAAPAAGAFSGVISGLASGNYTIAVRYSNDISITSSVNNVAIGAKGIFIGQSNFSGRANNPQSYTGTAGYFHKYTVTNNIWQEGNDPFDTDTANGSLLPLLASSLVTELGCPVALIGVAAGSTTLAQWQPGQTLNNRMLSYISSAASDGLEFICIWIGESDASAATSETDFKNRYNTLIDQLKALTGISPMLVSISGLANTDYANVRQWINDIAASNPNASDYVPQIWPLYQKIHYETDTETALAADAVGDGIIASFYTAGATYTLNADGAAWNYSGADADMTYTPVGTVYTLNANGASWSYSGGEASTLLSRALQADGQSLQYQSANAELFLNRLLQADGSGWSYAGGAASLTYDSGAAYTLVADGASFGYSSANAGLLFNRLLSASGVQYSYSGGIASLTYSGAVSVRINGYTMSYGVVPISAAFAN